MRRSADGTGNGIASGDSARADFGSAATLAADSALSGSVSPDKPDLGARVIDSSNVGGRPDPSKPPSGNPPRQVRTAKSASAKSGFTGKVNLNRAAAAELGQIKGIGEKTAQAIVDYRRTHGPYRDLRDLLQLKGIGEKKLEKLTPYLIL